MASGQGLTLPSSYGTHSASTYPGFTPTSHIGTGNPSFPHSMPPETGITTSMTASGLPSTQFGPNIGTPLTAMTEMVDQQISLPHSAPGGSCITVAALPPIPAQQLTPASLSSAAHPPVPPPLPGQQLPSAPLPSSAAHRSATQPQPLPMSFPPSAQPPSSMPGMQLPSVMQVRRTGTCYPRYQFPGSLYVEVSSHYLDPLLEAPIIPYGYQ